MQIVEIIDAISTTSCPAAVDDLTDGLLCNSFQASFCDFEKHATDDTKAWLKTSNKSVTVWHTMTSEGMIAGERIKIGRTSDGRWVLIVWECDQVDPSSSSAP